LSCIDCKVFKEPREQQGVKLDARREARCFWALGCAEFGSLSLCLLVVRILAACPKEEIKIPICFRKFLKSKFCIFAAWSLSILFYASVVRN
jgi:hypothetical protein